MTSRAISSFTAFATAAAILAAGTLPARSADLMCNSLVPPGQKMICAGFEPNWAVEFICDGDLMTSNFIDAFSGNDIQNTTGTVTFLTENPWQFETSHPITGTIEYTPAGCQDESDRTFDFTITPTGAPGLSGPFFPFCCRIE